MSDRQPTPDPGDLSQSLVLRMRAGDRDCAELMAELYRGPLSRFAARYLDDPHEAEDAVQDVFARALESEVVPDHFRAWLYRIARNVCLNRLRSRDVRGGQEQLPSAADFPAEATGHLTRLVQHEDRGRLAADLARLSPAQREALLLRYGEDLSRDEVARVLDLPVSVVKSRIYEGLQSLRRIAD